MSVRTGIYFIAVCLLAISCGRTEPFAPIIKEGDFAYSIQGLKDTSLERVDQISHLISVELDSGETESVTLSALDLPTGMEVYFDPTNGVDVSFNTTMVIKTVRTPVGKYKINIQGASASTGVTANYINIEVLPYSNDAVGLEGRFTETGNCSQTGNISESASIVADEQVKNRIIIKGMFSGVFKNEVHADLDPATKTLTIPTQTVNQLNYSGDGSYDDDKLIINYTVKDGNIVDESCSTTLTRN